MRVGVIATAGAGEEGAERSSSTVRWALGPDSLPAMSTAFTVYWYEPSASGAPSVNEVATIGAAFARTPFR